MPRELEGYRPQLELLTDMFPGRTGDFSPAKLLNLSIPAKKTANP